MPTYTIVQQWRWEEAFTKDGFGDGPQHVDEVIDAIENFSGLDGVMRYTVRAPSYPNGHITRIDKTVYDENDESDAEWIRTLLPPELVAHLDVVLPA